MEEVTPSPCSWCGHNAVEVDTKISVGENINTAN